MSRVRVWRAISEGSVVWWCLHRLGTILVSLGSGFCGTCNPSSLLGTA